MIDIKLIKAVLKGLLTYVPGVAYFLHLKKSKTKHSGANAEFCYDFWLRVLVNLNESGVICNLNKVGELGTGGSFGVGICALLTGTKQYFALDIDNHFDKDNNLKLLDEIVILCRNNKPISNRYKQLNTIVSRNDYPEELIMPRFWDDNFIEELRLEINSFCVGTKYLNAINDWEKVSTLNLDLSFSRAVMEHVRDPELTYMKLITNMNSAGYIFHDIEFHSHGITQNGEGHLFIPRFLWKVIFGKRSYFLNRWTLQEHINLLEKLGVRILKINKTTSTDISSCKESLFGATILAKV